MRDLLRLVSLLTQKAHYYVCEYSPQGNVIGQFGCVCFHWESPSPCLLDCQVPMSRHDDEALIRKSYPSLSLLDILCMLVLHLPYDAGSSPAVASIGSFFILSCPCSSSVNGQYLHVFAIMCLYQQRRESSWICCHQEDKV